MIYFNVNISRYNNQFVQFCLDFMNGLFPFLKLLITLLLLNLCYISCLPTGFKESPYILPLNFLNIFPFLSLSPILFPFFICLVLFFEISSSKEIKFASDLANFFFLSSSIDGSSSVTIALLCENFNLLCLIIY